MRRLARRALVPATFGLVVVVTVMLVLMAGRPPQTAGPSTDTTTGSGRLTNAAATLPKAPAAGAEIWTLPPRELEIVALSDHAAATEQFVAADAARSAPQAVAAYAAQVRVIRSRFEGAVAYAGSEAVHYRLGLAQPEREVAALLAVPVLTSRLLAQLTRLRVPAALDEHHRQLIDAIDAYAEALGNVRPSELNWGFQTRQEDARLLQASRLGVAAARYRSIPDVPRA